MMIIQEALPIVNRKDCFLDKKSATVNDLYKIEASKRRLDTVKVV